MYYILCKFSEEIYRSQEAYVKALGKGFSGAPFKTFTIRLGSSTGEQFHPSQNSSAEVCQNSYFLFNFDVYIRGVYVVFIIGASFYGLSHVFK